MFQWDKSANAIDSLRRALSIAPDMPIIHYESGAEVVLVEDQAA